MPKSRQEFEQDLPQLRQRYHYDAMIQEYGTPENADKAILIWQMADALNRDKGSMTWTEQADYERSINQIQTELNDDCQRRGLQGIRQWQKSSYNPAN
jgi:hypothetical protein